LPSTLATFPALSGQTCASVRRDTAIDIWRMGRYVGVQPQPLVGALLEEILQLGVLRADESPVQMLSPGKGKNSRLNLSPVR